MIARQLSRRPRRTAASTFAVGPAAPAGRRARLGFAGLADDFAWRWHRACNEPCRPPRSRPPMSQTGRTAPCIGIIANPVSARDVRRVIANASTLQLTDRVNMHMAGVPEHSLEYGPTHSLTRLAPLAHSPRSTAQGVCVAYLSREGNCEVRCEARGM